VKGRPPFTWDRLHRMIAQNPSWAADCEAARLEAEGRRAVAKYNTGAVPIAAGITLRGLTEWFGPRVVVEIGTFIGMSTTCMRARDHVYTCDKSNDCLPSDRGRTCYPYRGSTPMLTDLVRRRVRAGFFFFDGRIQMEDLPLIREIATGDAVFGFDDYEGGEKGVVNVNRLLPWLVEHDGPERAPILYTPDTRLGPNTIGLLVPPHLAGCAAQSTPHNGIPALACDRLHGHTGHPHRGYFEAVDEPVFWA